jgi:hypothetical protein
VDNHAVLGLERTKESLAGYCGAKPENI